MQRFIWKQKIYIHVVSYGRYKSTRNKKNEKEYNKYLLSHDEGQISKGVM